jgi:hypothetical protein
MSKPKPGQAFRNYSGGLKVAICPHCRQERHTRAGKFVTHYDNGGRLTVGSGSGKKAGAGVFIETYYPMGGER